MQLRRCHLFSTLTTTARNPIDHISVKSITQQWSQVFQPCNDLWYLPKICSRSWRICLCISISNSERWSRNIVMMSRWFALRPISSSKGRSHSMRTSIVCTIRKIFDTFSNPTIHSMYRSSIASRNGRLSRLSILGTGCGAILSLSLNATVPTKIQQFLKPYTLKNSDNLPRNQTNGRGSRLSKHLTCLKDLLQTSACHPSQRTDFSLLNSSQGRLSESSLSKHLTCVSGTYSQPQPIAILSMFISRQVVGAFTVQTPPLCLQDLLPTLACRDTPSIPKHVISGNHLTSHLQPMTSQSTCHKVKQKTRLI